MLVGAGALAAGVLLASGPGATPRSGNRSGGGTGGAHALASHTKRKPKETHAPRTVMGRWGVESTAVIAENHKPGTTAWQISATPTSGSISGFASTTYAAESERVTLYVSTSAKRYHVVAYRMGYYQGKGGRQIWRSGQRTGVAQPACPVTPGVNMVSCDNWAPSLTVRITSAWVPGDYLLKLVGTGGEQSYVLLTVWDPSSHAAYLVMARSLTEQGWNQYGGYSFYTGQGPCTLGQTGSYPQCNRARVVSFDRPYQTGDGASDFLGNEYPLVRFMEKHGLDAAYCTDIEVDEHPSILLHHRALLSLDHDETWTYPELK
ncbi:MAG: N,N-dimethylformamidase beta subunit family domain-containing protein, partial [Mycobacteriales bacterium]